VQVYATTDPKQATAMARRLIAKGYQAYTLEAPMRGVTWYRVRVGRFTSRERAKMMERRLKQLEGMEAAYVTPR
jgi:cell division septation protein DedD